jgi:Mg2+/Co2+ transporter CorB
MELFTVFATLVVLVLLVALGFSLGLSIAEYLANKQQQTRDEMRHIVQQTRQGMDERKALYTLEVLDLLKSKEKTNGKNQE